LKEWKIKNDYLLLDRRELPAYIEKGKKTGGLPLKNMSVALVDTLTEGIDSIKELVGTYIDGRAERIVPIHLDIEGIHIAGLLDQIYDERMISVCFSRYFNKYVLEAYIRHLLAAAAGEALESVFILAE